MRSKLLSITAMVCLAATTQVLNARGTGRSQVGELTEIGDLQPFTHIAYIPASTDLSSIKIKGIKAVKVTTKARSVMNPQQCKESSAREPGGSMYCPYMTSESSVPAYEVTYSFTGPPIASDEYSNTNFTFRVYFRPEELSPALHRTLSSAKVSRAAAAEFFRFSMSRDSIQQVAIDEANSTFCDGSFVDGNWTHTSSGCEDRIAYKSVADASPYLTVKVDPAADYETVAALTGSRQK